MNILTDQSTKESNGRLIIQSVNEFHSVALTSPIIIISELNVGC